MLLSYGTHLIIILNSGYKINSEGVNVCMNVYKKSKIYGKIMFWNSIHLEVASD